MQDKYIFTPEMDKVLYEAAKQSPPPTWKSVADRLNISIHILRRRYFQLSIRKPRSQNPRTTRVFFTPEMDQCIFDTINSDSPLPWEDLADRIGVSRSFLVRRFNTLGVKKPPAKRGPSPYQPRMRVDFTPEMDQCIISAVQHNPPPSWAELAAKLGVTKKIAVYRCKKLEVKKPPGSRGVKMQPYMKKRGRKSIHFTPEMDQYIITSVNKNPSPSWEAIAKQIFVSPRTVSSRCKVLGITKSLAKRGPPKRQHEKPPNGENQFKSEGQCMGKGSGTGPQPVGVGGRSF